MARGVQGYLLVTALWVMVILFILSTSLVATLSQHLEWVRHSGDRVRLQYTCQAGVQWAIINMKENPEWFRQQAEAKGTWYGASETGFFTDTYDDVPYTLRLTRADDAQFPARTIPPGEIRYYNMECQGGSNQATLLTVTLKRFAFLLYYLEANLGDDLPDSPPSTPVVGRYSIAGVGTSPCVSTQPVGVWNGSLFSNSKLGAAFEFPMNGVYVLNGDYEAVRGISLTKLYVVPGDDYFYLDPNRADPVRGTLALTGEGAQTSWFGSVRPDGTVERQGRYINVQRYMEGYSTYVSTSPANYGIQINGKVRATADRAVDRPDPIEMVRGQVVTGRDDEITVSANTYVRLVNSVVEVYQATAGGARFGAPLVTYDLATKPNNEMILIVNDTRQVDFTRTADDSEDWKGVHISGVLSGKLTLVSTTNINVDLDNGGTSYAGLSAVSPWTHPCLPGINVTRKGPPTAGNNRDILVMIAGGGVNEKSNANDLGSGNFVFRPIYGAIIANYNGREIRNSPGLILLQRHGATTTFRSRPPRATSPIYDSSAHNHLLADYDWRLRPEHPDYVSPPGIRRTVRPVAWE